MTPAPDHVAITIAMAPAIQESYRLKGIEIVYAPEGLQAWLLQRKGVAGVIVRTVLGLPAAGDHPQE